MSRRHLPARDLKQADGERARNKVSVAIRKSAGRPFDTEPGGRPDAEERAALWDGEPPPIDDEWIRRSYNLNKEIADYLSGRVTIKIGRLTARTLYHSLVGQNKKGP